MTKDVQHDRSASPLASVSDEIYPKTLAYKTLVYESLAHETPARPPEGAADAVRSALHEPEAPSASEPDSFEGFGSFG